MSENASSETTTVMDEMETTLEDAMKNIFTACDPDNSNSVPVSRLIDFITPFMQFNTFELMQLKEMLDPQNTNVRVNSETFYSVMTEWARRVGGTDEDCSFHEANPRDFDRLDPKDFPFVQSTPRSSFGHHFLKGYAESGIMNLSCFSACSEVTSAVPDKTYFEEQVKELVHQNRRLAEELVEAKLQLTASEEHIETLQGNLEAVARRLTLEQQAHELLQKNIKESDDVKDISGIPLGDYEELKRQKTSLERDNWTLKDQLMRLDGEKADLEQQIEEFGKKEAELKQQLQKLAREIELREEKLTNLEEATARMKGEIEEQRLVSVDYKKRSEELLVEKQALEKLVHKQHQQNLSTTIYHSFGPSDTSGNTSHLRRFSLGDLPQHPSPSVPSDRIRFLPSSLPSKATPLSCTAAFNSPRLLQQLRSPLSSLASRDSVFSAPIQTSTPMLELPSEEEREEGEKERLPTMYVVGRSPVLPVANNTSEEEYWNVGAQPEASPHESLQAELSKAGCEGARGRDCPHLIHLLERNHALLSLQYEMMEHENCANIIEQQKREIDKLLQQEEDNKKQMELLSFKILELNCQLNTSTTYVTEVKVNVDHNKEVPEKVEQQEMENLRAKLRNLEEEKCSFDRCLQCYHQKKAECDDLMVDLDEALRVQDEMRVNLEAVTKDNCALKEAVFVLEDTVRRLNLNDDKVSARIEELEMELASKTERISILKEEISFYNKVVTKSNSEVAMKNDEIESLLKKISEQEDANNNVTQNLNSLQSVIAEKDGRIRDLQKNVGMKVLDLIELGQINEQQKLKLLKVNSEINSYSQKYKTLQNLNQKLQDNLLMRQQEYDSLNDKFYQINRTNERLTGELENLQKETMEIHTLKTEMKRMENEKIEIESKLLMLEEKNQANESLMQSLHDSLLSARKELEELENKTPYPNEFVMYEKITHLQSTIDALKTEKTFRQEKLGELETTVDDLKKEKEEWGLERIELDHKIEDYFQEILVLQQKLEKSELSSECSDTYSSEFKGNKKETLSFSKMQVKVDRLQRKIENLEDLLENERRKNTEMERSLAVSSGTGDCDAQSTLAESTSGSQEMQMSLDDTMSRINELSSKLQESNISLASVLEQMCETDEKQKVARSLILNSWYEQVKKAPGRTKINFLEQVEIMKAMVDFNKQFSELLESVLQDRENCVLDFEVPRPGLKKFSLRPPTLVLRPVSPDSPSVDKEGEGDVFSSSFSSYGAGDNDEHQIHSVSEDLHSKSAFLNLPSDLLMYLDHHQDFRDVLPEEELEEKCGILMKALATDGSSIRRRLENQKVELAPLKERVATELQILKRSDLAKAFYQVCRFSETYGAMQEEMKVHNCMVLIRNYVSVVTGKTIKEKHCQKCTRNKLDQESKQTGSRIWRWMLRGIFVLMMLIAFVVLGNITTEIAFGGRDTRRTFYSWKDLSWQLLAPVAERRFCHKDCPH